MISDVENETLASRRPSAFGCRLGRVLCSCGITPRRGSHSDGPAFPKRVPGAYCHATSAAKPESCSYLDPQTEHAHGGTTDRDSDRAATYSHS